MVCDNHQSPSRQAVSRGLQQVAKVVADDSVPATEVRLHVAHSCGCKIPQRYDTVVFEVICPVPFALTIGGHVVGRSAGGLPLRHTFYRCTLNELRIVPEQECEVIVRSKPVGYTAYWNDFVTPASEDVGPILYLDGMGLLHTDEWERYRRNRQDI